MAYTTLIEKMTEKWFAEQLVDKLKIIKKKKEDGTVSVITSFDPIVIPSSMEVDGELMYLAARDKVLKLITDALHDEKQVELALSDPNKFKAELKKQVDEIYRKIYNK